MPLCLPLPRRMALSLGLVGGKEEGKEKGVGMGGSRWWGREGRWEREGGDGGRETVCVCVDELGMNEM